MTLPLDPPKHYDTEDRAAPEDQAEARTAAAPAPVPQSVSPTGSSNDSDGGNGEGDDEGQSTSTSEEPTREELYEKAQELDVEGRSSMDKDELQEAVSKAESSKSSSGKKKSSKRSK